ncbi:unnamed protein product [Euphydryas editha]|uniref:Peptidase aspartic putative domain-containing protein n=1 Tax=Euphydryas editha TaxID=104508 RepID=A0AAU9TPX2_EUPED|nr:unnamed protein product [Euphydryas editha]
MVSKSDEEDSARTSTSSLSSLSTANTTTLLQIVIVHITNRNNKKIPVSALFDSGSQRSYVKDEIMQRLQIQPVKKDHLKIQVFGGHNVSSKSHNLYNFSIENIYNSFKFEISALGQNCLSIPVREMLLWNYSFYVPLGARICHHHLNSVTWSELTFTLCDFTGQQFDVMSLMKKAAPYVIDFNNINNMPPALCHYWLGMNSFIPSLSGSVPK